MSYVSDIQEDLANRGWRWQETTFANGDVMLKFTLNPWCHALCMRTNPNHSDDCRFGWGRFPRTHAWAMAARFLIDEVSDHDWSIANLRVYKRKWNNIIVQHGVDEHNNHSQEEINHAAAS